MSLDQRSFFYSYENDFPSKLIYILNIVFAKSYSNKSMRNSLYYKNFFELNSLNFQPQLFSVHISQAHFFPANLDFNTIVVT